MFVSREGLCETMQKYGPENIIYWLNNIDFLITLKADKN